MKTLSLATILGLCATAPLAQSGPDIEFSGEISYTYLRDGSFDDEFISLELDIAGQFAGSSGLGYFLSYEAFAEPDDLGNPIDALYGGLSYQLGSGELQFGRPRSVLSDHFDGPGYGLAGPTSLMLSIYTGSVLNLLVIGDEEVWGLRYDGTYGPLGVGASVHYSPDADETLTALLLTYETGNLTPFLAVETASDFGGSGEPRYSIGTDAEYGPFSGQIAYTQNAAFNPDLSTLSLQGSYQINDAITVGASYLSLMSSGSTTALYGIGGEYTFGSGAFARADVTHFDGSADTEVAIEIGYRF